MKQENGWLTLEMEGTLLGACLFLLRSDCEDRILGADRDWEGTSSSSQPCWPCTSGRRGGLPLPSPHLHAYRVFSSCCAGCRVVTGSVNNMKLQYRLLYWAGNRSQAPKARLRGCNEKGWFTKVWALEREGQLDLISIATSPPPEDLPSARGDGLTQPSSPLLFICGSVLAEGGGGDP